MGLTGGTNVGPAYGRILLDAQGFRRDAAAIRQESRNLFSTMSDSLSGVGTRIQGIGREFTLALAPVTAFATRGILAFANFDEILVGIQARTRATAEEMEVVRATAMQMGQDTAFSATQAAEAMLQLLSSGYDLEQTLAALPSVLDLAAAGGLDLGYAADALTDILAIFGLEATDAAAAAEALGRASQTSSATVDDMIQAMTGVGGAAQLFGLTVNDTAAILAVFAENGIKGAEAGTQLRSMLRALSADTSETKEIWEELGISLYDTEGQMRNFNDVLGDLNVAMDGMSDQDRIRIIQQLGGAYGQAGLMALLAAGGYGTMLETMEQATGISALAAAQMTSFKGILRQLGSTIETLSINILGPLVENYLKPLVAQVTATLNKFNEWIVQNPKVAAALGLIVGVLAVLGPMLYAFGAYLRFAALGLGGLLSPVGLLIVAIGALYAAFATNFLGIRDAVMPYIEELVGVFNTVAASIRGAVDAVLGLDIVQSFIAGLSSGIKKVTGVFGQVQAQFTGALGDLFVTGLTDAVDDAIARHAPRIIEQGGQALTRAFSDTFSGMSKAISTDGAEELNQGFLAMGEAIDFSEFENNVVVKFSGVITRVLNLLLPSFNITENAVNRFGVTINNVGDAIEREFTRASGVVSTFTAAIRTFLTEHPEILQFAQTVAVMATGFWTVGAAVAAFASVLQLAIGPIIAIGGVIIGTLLSPVVLLAAAVSGLVVAWQHNFLGIQGLLPALSDLRGRIGTLASDVRGRLVTAFDELQKRVGLSAADVRGRLGGAFDDAAERLRPLAWDIRNRLGDAFDDARGRLQPLAADLQNRLAVAFDTARERLTPFIEDLQGRAVVALDMLRERINRLLARFNLGGLDDIIERFGGWNRVIRLVGMSILGFLIPPLGILFKMLAVGRLALHYFEGAGGDASKAFKNFAKDVTKTANDLLGLAGDVFEPLAEMAFGWLQDMAPKAVDKLGEMGLAIIQWIGDMIPVVLAEMLRLGAAFLSWLGPVVQQLFPALGRFIGAALEWIFGTGVPLLIEGTLALIVILVKWIYDAIPLVAPALGEFIQALIGYIIDYIPALAEGMLEVAKGMINGLVQGFSRLGGDLLNGLIPALQAVDWGQVARDVWDWIKLALGTVLVAAWDAAASVRTNILDPVIAAVSNIDWGQVATDVWNAIVSVFDLGVSLIWNGAYQLLYNKILVPLVREIVNVDWGQAATDIWNAIVLAFDTGVGLVWNGAYQLLYNKILVPLVREVSNIDLASVAGSIWNAIIDALNSAVETVWDAGPWLTTNIVDPIRKAAENAVDAVKGAVAVIGTAMVEGISDAVAAGASIIETAFKHAINQAIPDSIGITIGNIEILGQQVWEGGSVQTSVPDPFPGYQKGTPWTGSGAANRIAGIVHNREGVVPESGLMVKPSPRGLLLGGTERVETALDTIMSGLENMAQLMAGTSRLIGSSQHYAMAASTGGGSSGINQTVGSGNTWQVQINLSAADIRDEPRIQANAERFADAFMQNIRRRGIRPGG